MERYMSGQRRAILVAFSIAVALDVAGLYFLPTLAAAPPSPRTATLLTLVTVGFVALPLELVVVDIIVGEYFAFSDRAIAVGAIAVALAFFLLAVSIGWFGLFTSSPPHV